ncbi:MAG: ribonuclease P protein component [Paludibacteraceae bacterium]|nr:ribonuclease P protein component [Paludibacteraceae bacterium]
MKSAEQGYKFGKRSKLCGEMRIRRVYAMGQTAFVYPLRLCWLREDGDDAVRVMVVARKKLFKHAVDRNRIKRLLREAYRLNQHLLCSDSTQHTGTLNLILMYSSKQMPDYQLIERAVRRGLSIVCDTLHSSMCQAGSEVHPV